MTAKGSGNMSRGAAGRRSVGAAGGGHPNGAILDDTAEILATRKQRFKAWKEGYRGTVLKDAEAVCFDYSKSPKPGK